MRSNRTKHIMDEKDEIRRVDREIRRNEGYKKGGKIKLKAGGPTNANDPHFIARRKRMGGLSAALKAKSGGRTKK